VLNSIHKTTSLDPVFLKDLTKFSNPILANMWTYFAIGTISFPNFSSIFLYFGDLNSIDGFDSRRFRAILWLIAGGTRRGPNRIRILNLLRTKSLNAHQISKELDLDHKTVKHHIDVLVKNSLIEVRRYRVWCKLLSYIYYDQKYFCTRGDSLKD